MVYPYLKVGIDAHRAAKLLYDLKIVIPKMRTINHTDINMKNRIFAISAAPAAIPVKPRTPAIIAIIKNKNDHLSITFDLMNNKRYTENSVPT